MRLIMWIVVNVNLVHLYVHYSQITQKPFWHLKTKFEIEMQLNCFSLLCVFFCILCYIYIDNKWWCYDAYMTHWKTYISSLKITKRRKFSAFIYVRMYVRNVSIFHFSFQCKFNLNKNTHTKKQQQQPPKKNTIRNLQNLNLVHGKNCSPVYWTVYIVYTSACAYVVDFLLTCFFHNILERNFITYESLGYLIKSKNRTKLHTQTFHFSLPSFLPYWVL